MSARGPDSSAPSTTPNLSSARGNGGRVPALDGLRGLAILFVLIYHFVALAMPMGPQGSLFRSLRNVLSLTWSGVDLFFVLSGFLIGGILIDVRDSPSFIRTFYVRRASRILPAYALLVGAAFSWRHAADSGWRAAYPWLNGRFDPIWAYATFTQNFFMAQANGYGTNWLAATWSLAIEEQFYLVLPLMVWLIRPSVLPWVLSLGIAAAPLVRLLFFEFHPHQGFPAHVLMPARLDVLFIGVLAAWALKHPVVRRVLSERTPFLYGLLALLVGGAVLLGIRGAGVGGFRMGFMGGTWLAILYLVLLLISVSEQSGAVSAVARSRPLRALGRVSYATYLWHQPIAGLIFGPITGGEPRLASIQDVGLVLLALGVTLGLAWLSWILVEAPLVQRGHRFSYANAESPSSETDPVTRQRKATLT